MTNPPSSNRSRPVRSYVIRAGRLTDSQRRALEQHAADYVIPFAGQTLDLANSFDTPGPLTVEIGFGMGASLLQMASDAPGENFLGIEVHPPGVGRLIMGIVEQDLHNLKIIQHDAIEVLQQGLGEASVDRLLIFFPDPWPKKRHNKRRLVQPDFIRLAVSRLKPGGRLHLATDWEEYAQQMREIMEATPGVENAQGAGNFWSDPDRPPTKFEARGKRLGHGVWDLLYVKRPA